MMTFTKNDKINSIYSLYMEHLKLYIGFHYKSCKIFYKFCHFVIVILLLYIYSIIFIIISN